MKFNEVFIFSPTDIVSGGVNSLHILCKSLINNHIKVRMFYENPSSDFLNNPIIKAFNVPYTSHLEDISSNLLIVPEAMTSMLQHYKQINKMVYWLGIYFYFKKPAYRFPLNFKPLRKIFTCTDYFGNSRSFFHTLAKKINYWNKKHDPIWSNGTLHMSNSFYAADFIKSMGVQNVFVLHNPIRQEYYNQEPSSIRLKKILFGPKTPKWVFRKIKTENADFECIRLKHIAAAEVKKLYGEAQLFVELGNFAGRDRMPREAVLSGCVILSSRNGSANYYNDLQLPDYYKINTHQKYTADLIEKTKNITGNYTSHYANMKPYVDYLIEENQNFDKVVSEIFERI